MRNHPGLHEFMLIYGFFGDERPRFQNIWLAVVSASVRPIQREPAVLADLIKIKPSAVGDKILYMLKSNELHDKWCAIGRSSV